MTASALPKKLKKEPLVDAIFEIRFSSSTPASSLLPGFFFAKLEPKEWQTEALPVAAIPSAVRNLDPNFRYQPLMKIHWDNFALLVGDSSMGVGCKMPYPGWTQFRPRIARAVEFLRDAKIVQNVERYSLKYVDVVEGKDLAEQIQRVNINLRVGSHTLEKETFSVRVEFPNANFLNVIQIAATAVAPMMDGSVKAGALVDIDTICNYNTNDVGQFTNELIDRLEAIHNENKKVFFECLTPETITFLEPDYE